jgi:hypothetical protein
MKKKNLFSIAFLTSSLMTGFLSGEPPHFLSYDEWKEISDQPQEKMNQIVLRDGSRLSGTVEKLPSLCYDFAVLDFQVNEVIAIAAGKLDSGIKLQYVTQSGQNYVASGSKEKFVCTRTELNLHGESKEVKKEIDPAFIDYIILSKPIFPYAGYNSRLGSLQFKNGDQLPVALLSYPILVTDGRAEKSIHSENIVNISFDGGLHGKINKNGCVVDLDFSYIKDPYLSVQIPRNYHYIKFLWSQIAHIQTSNGGFFRENEIRNPIVSPTAADTDPFVSKDSKIGMGWNRDGEAPDQIGLKKGEALLGALAAISISQDTIVGLENIGHEPILASEQLFSAPEEEAWAANISIEDFIEEKFEPMPQFRDEPINEIYSTLVFEEDASIEDEIDPFSIPMLDNKDDSIAIEEDFEIQDNYIIDDELEAEKDYVVMDSIEDFEIQDNYIIDDELETEKDYLEDIAMEIDTLTSIDEIEPETMNSEKMTIGIDEIIAQEIEFSEPEDDLTLAVDSLWDKSVEENPPSSSVEKAFVEELWK